VPLIECLSEIVKLRQLDKYLM